MVWFNKKMLKHLLPLPYHHTPFCFEWHFLIPDRRIFWIWISRKDITRMLSAVPQVDDGPLMVQVQTRKTIELRFWLPNIIMLTKGQVCFIRANVIWTYMNTKWNTHEHMTERGVGGRTLLSDLGNPHYLFLSKLMTIFLRMSSSCQAQQSSTSHYKLHKWARDITLYSRAKTAPSSERIYVVMVTK